MIKLKDLVPPLLWRVVHRVPEVVDFPSFAAAEAACAEYSYESRQLVETVFQKTRIYRDQLPAQRPIDARGPASAPLVTVMAALLQARKVVHVLDFGGACGAHYFAMRAAWPANMKLRWVIVETPGMVARARELQNEELEFCENLGEACEKVGVPDLVHSSGALPFVPQPYEALNNLLAVEAKHVVLSRLFLTVQDRDLITIQRSRLSEHGPGRLPQGLSDGECRYPITYLPQATIEGALSKRYKLLLRWKDASPSVGKIGVTETAYWGNLEDSD